MAQELQDLPLAEIVRNDFRASKILDKYGLDFCCKGKRTLSEACDEKNLNAVPIEQELQQSLASARTDDPLTKLTASELIDHIVDTHHKYVVEYGPLIHKYLFKVSTKHGDRYPYMPKVFALYTSLFTELSQHMKEEENVVFPLLKKIEADGANSAGETGPQVSRMEEEHESAGNLLAAIRELTSDFTIPPQACNTFRVVLHLLEEFETDLHSHVFKENHILFPKFIQSSAASN